MTTGKKISELKRCVQDLYGQTVFVEASMPIAPVLKTSLLNGSFVTDSYPQPLDCIDTQDGIKWVFKTQDWVLVRPSGTEDVVRLYAESSDNTTALALLGWATHQLGGRE